ncbi:MAG: apolipoprotein N-acyltransferase [Rhodoferax sp.]|uniref:apolipoprotein N-acyltransferase n=1 Tax=Rhodoferax sp. TaxID=50421 RepID=UPI0013FF1C6C|nr:apolipoprotein N-acyltransferase [Rhodoferax sp.]NDP39601.1 apolipoprotein N-acyltransferase [Rhodoferax sp.]
MPRLSALPSWIGSLATPAPRVTLWRLAMVLLAGLAHAASLAWPWSLPETPAGLLGLRLGEPVWWLQLLALGTLAWLLERCRHNWRVGALWAWLFSTAWLIGSFGWTYVAMHTYGGLPSWLAALAVLALAGLLAVYYAAVCGLFVALAIVHRALAAIVFASLWVLAELARGIWLTGFGWGAAGYGHVDGPLAAYAPWLGLYGLCALAAWLAMSGVQIVQHDQPWRQRAFTLALALALLALPPLQRLDGADTSGSTGRLAVTLLQGNIPQNEKFESGTGVPLALRWYGEQLTSSRTALVIAPETALPVLPQQLPPAYWRALQQRFATGQQAAIIGTPLGNAQDGYTNSVVGLKPGQAAPWRYDKHHLVPFGEFIPPMFKWFNAMMNIPLGDFNRGAPKQAPFDWQGQRLSANICVEDLYSEELGLLFGDPALAPTIFVNVSNLAWFGNGLAMDQHLQIARLRALEFARPMVLATNTGLTAIVDHRGRVTHALARNTRGALVGEVEGRTGVTFYGWWVSRYGLWPLWLLALSLVLLGTRSHLRKRRSSADRSC